MRQRGAQLRERARKTPETERQKDLIPKIIKTQRREKSRRRVHAVPLIFYGSLGFFVGTGKLQFAARRSANCIMKNEYLKLKNE
jgi:hypothetical protein